MIDLLDRFSNSRFKHYSPDFHEIPFSLFQIIHDIQFRPHKYSAKHFETINRMVKMMNFDHKSAFPNNENPKSKNQL